jgi:hypothetical protein
VIFTHEFAEAFWGDKQTVWKSLNNGKMDLIDTIPAWQYHLQRIVLEEEPLKYLEQFIKII